MPNFTDGRRADSTCVRARVKGAASEGAGTPNAALYELMLAPLKNFLKPNFFRKIFLERKGDQFFGVRRMKHEPFFSTDEGRRFEPLAYSVDDAAAILGISRQKLYDILNIGDLGGKKLGRRTIILHYVLVEFLEGLPDYEIDHGLRS